MALKLEKVFTLRAFLSKEDLLPLGPIKEGPHRFTVPITHGFLEGSGIKAQLVQGGSNWILMDTTTRTAYLDVRLQGRTSEGNPIYIHYPGILKVDDATQKVLEWSPDAKTTRVEDHYLVFTPAFETSSQSLKWMEQSIFVGHGRWVVPGDGTQAVEYDIYNVVSAKLEL